MPAVPKPPARPKKPGIWGRKAEVGAPSQLKRTRMKARSEKMEAVYAGESDDCGPCPACGGSTWEPHHQHDGRIMPIDCRACGGTGREGRRAFNARILGERRGQCQVCPRIQSVNGLGRTPPVCGGPLDVHEILSRSAGGSILDPDNVLVTCRNGHMWIGDNPKQALALGLRHSRYPARNPTETTT